MKGFKGVAILCVETFAGTCTIGGLLVCAALAYASAPDPHRHLPPDIVEAAEHLLTVEGWHGPTVEQWARDHEHAIEQLRLAVAEQKGHFGR